jgi:hypothetical protein
MKETCSSRKPKGAFDTTSLPMPTKAGGLVDFDRFFAEHNYMYAQQSIVVKALPFKNQGKLSKICRTLR